MKAIKFTTKIQKGTIKIPAEYIKALQHECRVIILVDEPLSSKKTRVGGLKALRIKTKNLRFDRNKVI